MKQRLIQRLPGRGAMFRGRCTPIEEIWHRPDPPERLRGIGDLIRWMRAVELGMRWVYYRVRREQNWRQN